MHRLTSLPFLLFAVACGGSASSNGGGGGSNSTLGDGDGDTGDGDGDAGTGGSGDGDGDGDGDAGTGGSGDGDGDAGTGGSGARASGGAESGGAGGENPGSGGAPVFGDVELFCEESCTSLTPFPGGCAELYICGEGGECLERASRWSEEARDTFEWCVENDAMCFQTAEGCMLKRLYENIDLPYRLTGKDFNLPDGTEVGIALRDEALVDPSIEGTLSGGAFTLELTGGHYSDSGYYMVVWVDENGDGVCSEGDRVAQPRGEFNGNFSDPAFIVEVTPDDVGTASHQNCLEFF